jgi:endonuclease III
MSASKPSSKEVAETLQKLRDLYPDAHCELDYASTFQLLVAVVLSAQTTDKLVNKVTPALFSAYPNAEKLALAQISDVETLLNRLGMFRQKAKNIVGLSKKILKEFEGDVPDSMESLITLPGVGRKTANVVLGVAFRKPEGVVVDTHVQRISQRLGWTAQTVPPKIERDLMELFPRSSWDELSHLLIFHGRRVCFARSPMCSTCGVNERCKHAGQAELVGRKPPRPRKVLKVVQETDTSGEPETIPQPGSVRKTKVAKATNVSKAVKITKNSKSVSTKTVKAKPGTSLRKKSSSIGSEPLFREKVAWKLGHHSTRMMSSFSGNRASTMAVCGCSMREARKVALSPARASSWYTSCLYGTNW